MGAFVIQSKEGEIDFDLFQQLAEVLSRETQIPKADAKLRIKNSYGMLLLAEEEQARKVSEQFQNLGLDNFVLRENQLLQLPRHEILKEDWSDIEKIVELVAVGAVYTETTKKTRHFKPWKIKIAYPRIPIPSTMFEEETTKKTQSTCYLNMLTQNKHWRKPTETLSGLVIERLRIFDRSNVYLTENVLELFRGERNFITFPHDKDYNRYLSWLFQLRYAKPK